MKDEPTDTTDKPKDGAPDGRGPRPTDPNELAKWIVDQTADDDDDDDPSRPG